MQPAELAGVLKKLGADKAAYEKLLEFRDPAKHSLTKEFVDVAYRSYVHPMVACRICDYHQKRVKSQRFLMGTNATESM